MGGCFSRGLNDISSRKEMLPIISSCAKVVASGNINKR